MGRRVTDLLMLSQSKPGDDDVEIDFVGRAMRDTDDRRSTRRENNILRHLDRISRLGRGIPQARKNAVLPRSLQQGTVTVQTGSQAISGRPPTRSGICMSGVATLFSHKVAAYRPRRLLARFGHGAMSDMSLLL